jgi:glycosyltransferase involved in cell wall biosynthesis
MPAQPTQPAQLTALAVNGKWLAQPMTGTQRFAQELLRRLVLRPDLDVVLHVPRRASLPDWLPTGTQVVRSRLDGVAFEQLALPWAARGMLLLSLCGPAPLVARRQVAAIHDASPFRFPGTYTWAFGAWHRTVARVLARRAAALITVSNFSAGELAQVLRVPRGRFTVVPNGADHLDGLDLADPGLPPDGSDFVLVVGTLAVHKNLAPVLRVLAARGISTVVVGARGAGRVFAAADLPQGGSIRYAGRLTEEQLSWLYHHAGVLVFPSRYEGFGLPVVEAQRAGCPVVAGAVAALPEVAGAGAVLVPPDQPELMADAVERLLADPQERERLAAAGRSNAARFTWERSVEVLAAVVHAADADRSRLGQPSASE